jgi:hypothetical protein
MRLSRAYSHAIIDGTDYILVPQIQHAPTTTPNAHTEKAADMTSIEELRAMRDVWPIVLTRIPEAIHRAHSQLDQIIEDPDLIDHLERKFRKGEAEHGGEWMRNADSTWLLAEAAEEILDFIIYQALYTIHTDAMQNLEDNS